MKLLFIVQMVALLVAALAPANTRIVSQSPPNFTYSIRKCGAETRGTCSYCCAKFSSGLQGRVEYRMHWVYQGQVQSTAYQSYIGGSTWHFGVLGNPDAFVIKYRNVGSNTWHQSYVITPPKDCCYP